MIHAEDRRTGIRAVKSTGIGIHGKHRNRTDWIGCYPGRGGEIRDQQILGHVIVVETIAASHHGIRARAPGEANTWAENVQIPFVDAIETMCPDHCQSAVGRHIREQVILLTERPEVLPPPPEVQSEIRRKSEVILSEE